MCPLGFLGLNLIPRLSRSGLWASHSPASPSALPLYLPRDAEFVAAFGVPDAVESKQVWGPPHLSLNTKYTNF